MKRLSFFLTLLMAVCLVSGFAVNQKPVNKPPGIPPWFPMKLSSSLPPG
jgi:hypothetical protein